MIQATTTETGPAIVWFRQDLRLADNPALAEAIQSGRPILPVYILDEEGDGSWSMGGATRWWLHHALTDLHAQLETEGLRLLLRRGSSLEVLVRLVKETGARSVYWNRKYEPDSITRDQSIKAELQEMGLDVKSFNASLLHEPHTALKKDGTPYKVFTPYWKFCLTKDKASVVKVDFKQAASLAPMPESDALDSWELLPKISWDSGFYEAWEPTRKGAVALLKACLKQKLSHYNVGRDQMGEDGTSKLSPYLHFGQLGPREVWQAVTDVADPQDRNVYRYLAEIGWREFSYYLLYHFPHLPEKPLRPEFEDFPWQTDAKFLHAWQRGQTGFPIVDAGMRQLWATGWMHNRARMICASLLVKHLLQPWQEGARWFWDTLVDADLASNTQGWQWTAGCGADASPYFRVFNPILQGQKFDTDGTYVRRWVPELSKLPTAKIHSPWDADALELAEAGVTLGKDYPFPIVEHGAGRARALKAYELFKVSGLE